MSFSRYSGLGPGGIPIYPSAAAFPATAADGDQAVAADTNTIYIYNTSVPAWVPVATPPVGVYISDLTGDVTATGPGSAAATVDFVGGETAADVATSVQDTQAATDLSTPSTLVKRDASGETSLDGLNLDGSVSGAIALKAADTTTGYTVKMPAAQGAASSVLQNDGSGNLSWGALPPAGVTAVTGSAPIASSGGATPDISISQSSALSDGYLSSADWSTFNGKQNALSFGNLTEVTSSVLTITGGTGAVIGAGTTIQVDQAGAATDGYLSSADWNTFNSKQPAGTYVTSVGATAPVASSGGTTPTISMAQSSALADGYLSSVDWSTFNGKVSSVSGSAPIVSSGGTTPSISINNFTGATPLLAGLAGAVPAPIAGDDTKYLKGDGTWSSVTTLPAYSIDRVLYSTASAAEWRTVGTGSSDAAYPTNTIILGRTKPSGLLAGGQNNILVGSGTTANAITTATDSVIVGKDAAPLLTSSSSNVIIGAGSASALLTSGSNVIIGSAAATTLTGGSNVCIGTSSTVGAANSNAVAVGTFATATGSAATAINGVASGASGVAVGSVATAAGSQGVAVGASSYTGSGADCVVIGNGAGRSASTGANNTIMGRQAGDALTSGNELVLIGRNAGGAITTGVTTVAIGNTACGAATAPDRCVLIGNNCAGTATALGRSIGIGHNALANAATGFSVAIGEGSGQSLNTNSITGSLCAVGFSAGNGVTTGEFNTLIGARSGNGEGSGTVALTTGSHNTFLGEKTGGIANNISSGIALGKNAATNSNTLAVGGEGFAVNTVFLGTGAKTTTTAAAVLVQTQSASGTDTDLSASTLTLAGSRSTGNKDGGAVIVSTAPAGASGTTLNAHVERMRVTASGLVGVGTNSPSVLLHAQQTNSATNTVTNILRVDSQSSGTPAAGIGVGIEMAAETSAGNTEIGVVLEAVTTDVTAASEDFDLVVKNMAAGAAAAETLRITSVGDTKVVKGQLSVETAGKGLSVKEGTNAKIGVTGAFPGGGTNTVTVSNTAVTANSIIFISAVSGATTIDPKLWVSTINANSDFIISSGDNSFTGTVGWMIVERIP